MILDAHVHFWDPARLRYAWLDGLPSLRRAFTPAEYFATVGDRVDRVVFVEANCDAAENRDEVAFVERLAAADERIAAIVAYADMTDPHLGCTLDAFAQRPLVRGVRQNIQGNPAGICLRPAFIAGVREVGRRGLTFDICVTHDQLGDALALVQACPDARFVLDHGGKPRIGGAMLESWSVGLSRLAECPNVCCKLSGLLTEADESHRTRDALLPFAECIVNCFGVDRLMFGSDWPVVTMAGGFDAWLALVEELVSACTPSERERFYGGTAAAVYGVPTWSSGS
jgi:predicted TIM-barrel fold metal-dependent hydrolase